MDIFYSDNNEMTAYEMCIKVYEHLGIKVCYSCLQKLLPIELRLGDGKTCMDCE